ncbi:hypothetical protein M0805_002399 [Coniferiporia weirii]|nr:hypothetical protein M0805_002399 [Coniferiporia weirii]
MLHRPADSRLLSNLLSHEKDYVRSLHSQLDYGQSSLASFSAYAAASPPPASRAISAVASVLIGAHDAFRGYTLAVEEWCEKLKMLKDMEEEVGNIARDREILVDRLIKASKSNPKRRSIISSGLNGSPSASAPSSSTPTLDQLSFNNSKLNLAQNELKACEIHLNEKERILTQMRETVLLGGLKARCKALVECGWKWSESGKVGIRALDGPVNQEKDDTESTAVRYTHFYSFPWWLIHHAGPLFQKSLPNPFDSGARPSSDLSSSIAPSQSASQIYLGGASSEQYHFSSGGSSQAPHGPTHETGLHNDSSQFALSLPPAHAISEQDHYFPSLMKAPLDIADSIESNSTSDEVDESMYEVRENKPFSESSARQKSNGSNAHLPSGRQSRRNGVGLSSSTSAPLPTDHATSRIDSYGASNLNDVQQDPKRRKRTTFPGFGAIAGIFHRRARSSSLSLVSDAGIPSSSRTAPSSERGGRWVTRTDHNLKKSGQADDSSDDEVAKRTRGSDTAVDYESLRRRGNVEANAQPIFRSGSGFAVTEAGPSNMKATKQGGAAGKKLRKTADSALKKTNTLTNGQKEVRRLSQKPMIQGASLAQSQSTGDGHVVNSMPVSVSHTSSIRSQSPISGSGMSTAVTSFETPTTSAPDRRHTSVSRSDSGRVPLGKVHQRASSYSSVSAPASRGQASLMTIVEDVSLRNRRGWLQSDPNSLLVEVKAPKSVHDNAYLGTVASLPQSYMASPAAFSHGKNDQAERRPGISPMTGQNAGAHRLSTIMASSSEPSLPLGGISATRSAHEPATPRKPLKSALRSSTPSPDPFSASTSRNKEPVRTAGVHSDAKGPSNVTSRLSNPSRKLNDDDDAASNVSSDYETGNEDLGDTQDEPPAPPPHDEKYKLVKGLTDEAEANGTQLSGTASSSTETATQPSRKKSVRVSMQPTFSPTPPALADYEEENRAPWVLSSSKDGSASSDTWQSRIDESNAGWTDSSDEDEEYSRAKQMLHKASKKLDKALPRASCESQPFVSRSISMSLKRPVLIVAGVGNGSGTGAATAKVFAKAGFRVALIARNADHLKKTADDINAAGGEAAPFPVSAYTSSELKSAFDSVASHWPASTSILRAAVWNAGYGIWKPFLDITDEEVGEALDTNVRAAFAFSRFAISAFKENELDERGKRGTLIFTGATAAWRGNKTTSAFAAGKFGLRALSQSLNKEFGKSNIHVAHAIIDGGILTDLWRERKNDPSWEQNKDVRLDPESIANTYLFLSNQDRSAWTWELDLRPAHENW